MQHNTSRRPLVNRQGGFTLIELMVGALLGMLTVLVIAQVLAQSEGRRRTISMGNDAEVNGSLSMFSLQRDIQLAGYGISAKPDALGCLTKGKYSSSGTPFTMTLAPVIITNGASGAPDSITVLSGNTRSSSVPMKVTENHPQTQGYFVVESALGARVGDQVIAVPDVISGTSWCTLISVTNDTSAPETTLGTTRIPHGAGSQWNQSAIHPVAGYAVNSYLLDVGAMIQRTYSISANNNLQTTDIASTNGAITTKDLYPQIVNIQALYGKDTNGDGSVDLYEAAAPAAAADWQKVIAIRLAIVARSNQYEKESVTSSEPLWDVGDAVSISGETIVDSSLSTGTSCPSGSKCIVLKVSTDTNWQHYRYKVYNTTVPLRNVLWNS